MTKGARNRLDGKCQPFDGFPKSGQLAELSNKAVVFRAKALKAAPDSVRMPRLADVQVGPHAGGPSLWQCLV